MHDNGASISSINSIRPTLDIFAQGKRLLGYKPDPNWTRALGETGYRVNIHEINEQGERNTFSQLSLRPTGTLRMDGLPVPLGEKGAGRPLYRAKGVEHDMIGRCNNRGKQKYFNWTRETRGESPRSREERYERGKARNFGLPQLDEDEKEDKCTTPKVLCLVGAIAGIVLACVAPWVCR